MLKKLTLAGMIVASIAIIGAVSASADIGYAAGDVLNIRQVPAMDAKVLGEFYLADPIEVITIEGSWCKVSYNDEVGYIHKDLIVFDRSLVPEPAPVIVHTPAPAPAPAAASSSGTAKAAQPKAQPKAASPAKASSSASSPSGLGSQIVAYAKNFLGVPYVYGGSSPSGFDCSGFVQYVYRNFGISLPRTTYSQVAMGRSVSRGELQPGDLVFFRSAGHVGIYVGGETYIHAPQTGRTISVDNMSGRSLYAARRII